MAAVSAPYGLIPVRSMVGSGTNAGLNRLYKVGDSYATDIFYGDIVSLSAGVIIKSTATTATAAMIGVFQGCTYTDATLKYKVHKKNWVGGTVSTDIQAYVCDDPFMIYQAQADGAIGQTGLGENANLIQTNGTDAIGMSRVTIDATTVVTNGLPVRIVGFVDGPDSAVGDAFTDVLVMLNPLHAQLLVTTGVT
jgi:hypothetical protein